MKLPLTYYGNPILRKKGAPVEKIDADIIRLVNDMIETVIEIRGAGLAAPQVNRSLALFITRFPVKEGKETLRVFINPKIISHSAELWGCNEGCLSIPKLYGHVERPQSVLIEATDLSSKIFREEFYGYQAHVVMHENDHIHGVLYIDRLDPKERKKFEPYLKEIKKKYNSKS